MKLTIEQFELFKNCKSAEEIIAKGSEIGLSITQDSAKKYLESLRFEELNGDDINIAGGACTTTRACRMCHRDISHEAFYRHTNTGHEYCCSCAANSQMVGNREYEYISND